MRVFLVRVARKRRRRDALVVEMALDQEARSRAALPIDEAQPALRDVAEIPHARRIAARQDEPLLALDEADQPVAPRREEAQIRPPRRRAPGRRAGRESPRRPRCRARTPRAPRDSRRSGAPARAHGSRARHATPRARDRGSPPCASERPAPARGRRSAREIDGECGRDAREPTRAGRRGFDERFRSPARGALPCRAQDARAPRRAARGIRAGAPMPRDTTSRSASTACASEPVLRDRFQQRQQLLGQRRRRARADVHARRGRSFIMQISCIFGGSGIPDIMRSSGRRAASIMYIFAYYDPPVDGVPRERLRRCRNAGGRADRLRATRSSSTSCC